MGPKNQNLYMDSNETWICWRYDPNLSPDALAIPLHPVLSFLSSPLFSCLCLVAPGSRQWSDWSFQIYLCIDLLIWIFLHVCIFTSTICGPTQVQPVTHLRGWIDHPIRIMLNQYGFHKLFFSVRSRFSRLRNFRNVNGRAATTSRSSSYIDPQTTAIQGLDTWTCTCNNCLHSFHIQTRPSHTGDKKIKDTRTQCEFHFQLSMLSATLQEYSNRRQIVCLISNLLNNLLHDNADWQVLMHLQVSLFIHLLCNSRRYFNGLRLVPRCWPFPCFSGKSRIHCIKNYPNKLSFSCISN